MWSICGLVSSCFFVDAFALEPMPKPEIIPYQPAWPAEFEAIAARLRQALGPLAARVDHIGSTAVPGLAAKDVIDVQISVAALDAATVQALTAALTGLGY